MKRKNMTRSALVTSILALLVCVSMLVGATFAWFTDSVESGRNVIAAGNLDVELYNDAGQVTGNTKLFDDVNPDLWEPGAVAYENLQVKNVGTLALKYNLELTVLNETVVGEHKLSDVIKVGIVEGGITSDDRNVVIGQVDTWTNLSDFSLDMNGKELAAKTDDAEFGIVLYWQPNSNEIDNLYNMNNGSTDVLKLDIGVNLYATQVEAEFDSFGNDYDAGLNPEAIYVFNAQELKDAMLVRGAQIALGGDIPVDADTPLQWGAYMFVANGREVTIDLNGHDIVVEENALLQTNAVFTTANGGTLNIVGEGTVTVENGKSGIFHAMNKNDQINIYGGTYISNSDNGSDALAIMYTNSGNIDVYGGTFLPLVGVQCANAENIQGDRLSIVFHEGAMLNTELYQKGDSTRIQLAEGCYLKKVQIDGEEWWQVVKPADATVIKTFADMVEVCKTGGKMVLANDITYTAENTEEMIAGSIFLINGKNVVVDMNGHDITIAEDAERVYGAIFFVGNPGGHIDIVGDGEITVKNGLATVVWTLQSGTANIYGGTYSSNSASHEAMFYSQGNGGVINVYGGKYTYDLDRHLNGGFNVSDQAGGALRIILHEGVLLSRPEYSQHLQGTTNGEENRIQLAEGCTLNEVVIDGETWYQVVKA